jgi:hypothetical protein
MKKIAILLPLLIFLGACDRDAEIASKNLSYAADNFEINRRIVFYNGITNDYILSVEGRCSIEESQRQLEVTCKTANSGKNAYKKHFLGLSDNVTYFAEQLAAADVSTFHYRVIFKPESILPDIDLKLKSDPETPIVPESDPESASLHNPDNDEGL